MLEAKVKSNELGYRLPCQSGCKFAFRARVTYFCLDYKLKKFDIANVSTN